MGVKAEPYKLSKRYNKTFDNPGLFVPNEKFNGFAHPHLPIVCEKEIVTAQWGLMPTWSNDISFAKNTLNARIESLEEKPSFKNYTQNRCLIPATSFYDWRHEGKEKLPFVIYSQEEEIFSMAGIYSDWKNEIGETIRTFSMLTTEANEIMRYIHNTKNRMPVILKKADEDNYLHGTTIENYAFPYETSLLSFRVD